MIHSPGRRIERYVDPVLNIGNAPVEVVKQSRAFRDQLSHINWLFTRKRGAGTDLLGPIGTFLDGDELIAYNAFRLNGNNGIFADHTATFSLNLQSQPELRRRAFRNFDLFDLACIETGDTHFRSVCHAT